MSNENRDIEKLRAFFEPTGVAIIGASHTPGKIGYQIVENFVKKKEKGVFGGEIYLINPKGGEILGYKVYRSVLDVKEKIDHAVIAVPAKVVPKVLEDCGKKGIEAVVIISAGFSETGNYEAERELKRIARKYGMRVIGPNCLGIYSAYTGVDHLFLPEYKTTVDGRFLLNAPRPKAGYITLLTQSGAFGVAALDYMAGSGIGVSKFVSYGNRIDVDEATLIEYLVEDKTTRVIMLYTEGVANGRRFLEVVREATLRKPILVFKAGRTKAGARAVASHTAALAGSDQIYDAVFKQSGCVRAQTMEEFFDMAKALAYQPPAKGRNVAILTDGGGAGVMATDACEILGLNVPRTPEDLRKELKFLMRKGVIPEFASIENPIDLTGSVNDEMFRIVAELLINHPQFDSLVMLALHHPPAMTDRFVDEVAKVIKESKKPVVAVDIGMADFSVYVREKLDRYHIPSYPSPERAVTALSALVRYGEYLKKRKVINEYLETWIPAE